MLQGVEGVLSPPTRGTCRVVLGVVGGNALGVVEGNGVVEGSVLGNNVDAVVVGCGIPPIVGEGVVVDMDARARACSTDDLVKPDENELLPNNC